MSSHEDIKSAKSGNEELTMRRARLRGSLAKRALPPDPYAVVPDNQEVQPVGQRGKSSKAQKSSESIAISQEKESTPETYTVAIDSNEPQSTVLTSPKEDLLMSDSEAKSTAVPLSLEDMVDDETIISADKGSSTGSHSSFNASHVQPTLKQTISREIVVEHLSSIDQTLSACATNLAALQKVTDEQFDSLKNLSEMLQHQVFSELSLNLTSITESLSQALEPMKAAAELVPAIDQLVGLMESKEKKEIESSLEPRLTPDQLIIRLADKLSSGHIDSSTFKAACMAVYPADDPADLLHRLVELLGTERLAGELFQAAYDAVQAPELASSIAGGVVTGFSAITGNDRVEELVAELESLREINERLKKQNGPNDQHLLEELEALRKANEEYKGQLRKGLVAKADSESEGSHKTVEELQEKLRQYEEEFSHALAQRDDELQEARELLNSRWEEFNTRYDELTETLHRRDELLKEREMELQRKDSEITQLKAQMEELQEQTKDMIISLQKQLSSNVPKEDTSKSVIQHGFFDVAPSAAPAPSLFDHAPKRPLFEQEPSVQNISPVSQPDTIGRESPSAAQGGSFQQETHPLTQPQTTQKQERVTQPTQFTSGAGSYGSGVRAQVFEVIVRQALAGAPWREICAGPMQVNNITPEEVEAEVKHRQAILGKT